MSKCYFYQYYKNEQTANGPYGSIEAMLEDIRNGGEDPSDPDYVYYEAVEGKYVPPSSPETVRFPS